MEFPQLVAPSPPPGPPRPRPLPALVGPMPNFGDAATPSSTPLEDGHTLGLALLLTGVGSALGLSYAGVYGGIAGGFAGGSIVNAWRAYRCLGLNTPAGDTEAIVSGTYAVLGAAASAYLIYKGRGEVKPGKTEGEE